MMVTIKLEKQEVMNSLSCFFAT